MRLNMKKVASMWTCKYKGMFFKYGFTDKGKAFIAIYDDLISKSEAIGYLNVPRYYNDLPMNALINFLRDRYNN